MAKLVASCFTFPPCAHFIHFILGPASPLRKGFNINTTNCRAKARDLFLVVPTSLTHEYSENMKSDVFFNATTIRRKLGKEYVIAGG